MTILLLDTSGPVCGAAIVRDGKLIGETNCQSGRRHSVQAMPILDSLLFFSQMALSDMDVFAAVSGPGSFTGIRIGITTIAALAEAQEKPCLPLSATEALAAGAGCFEGLVCPLIDARSPRVYSALFRPGVPPLRVSQDRQTTVDAVLAELRPQKERVLFTGDAACLHSERIRSELPGRAEFVPEHLGFLRAGAACILAHEKTARGAALLDPSALRSIYLQPSQAEREEKAGGKP